MQKFSYLLDNLKGDAAKKIKGFTLSAASYREAVKLLKEEYGDRKTIIQGHIDELCKMQSRPQAHDTASMKQLYLDVTSHAKALEALGQNIVLLGKMLVTTLLHKMPI